MTFETNADEWAEAQAAAEVWTRKAPESPLATIATEHQPYWMYWLDAHQFHPWGWNVQQLMATPGWPITPLIANATTSVVASPPTTESAALASPPLDT